MKEVIKNRMYKAVNTFYKEFDCVNINTSEAKTMAYREVSDLLTWEDFDTLLYLITHEMEELIDWSLYY